MQDILRASKVFPGFLSAIQVHFVEASAKLAKKQQLVAREAGVDSRWHLHVDDVVVGDDPLLVIAQEFFDALPVHQFEFTERGWCERLIDVDPAGGEAGETPLVVGEHGEAGETLSLLVDGARSGSDKLVIDLDRLKALEAEKDAFETRKKKDGKAAANKVAAAGERQAASGGDGIRLVLSPSPTHAARVLLDKDGYHGHLAETPPPPGKPIEVCPAALGYTEKIADIIASNGGAAIVIDYALDELPRGTLQAIRKHEFTPLLDDPGLADLSAYVDYSAMRRVVTKRAAVFADAQQAGDSGGSVSTRGEAEAGVLPVDTFGPLTQAQFLARMGINERLEALADECDDDEAVDRLVQGYQRLMDEDDMGGRYLALAIAKGTPTAFDANA